VKAAALGVAAFAVSWGGGGPAAADGEPRPGGGPAKPAAPALRWIAGDLHVHVSPPDAPGHSALTVAQAVAKARELGLDFLVLAPHAADASFPSPEDPAAAPVSGQALEARLAAEALAAPPPPGPDPSPDANGKPGPASRPLLVVPGWEYTREWPGHMTLAFFRMEDVATLEGDAKCEKVLAGGGLAVVNHPFFRPVKMAPAYEKLLAGTKLEPSGDRRWKPFFGEGKDPLRWNAIEVWHERSVLVEKLHAAQPDKYPDTQMAKAALAAWDRSVTEQRRRIVAVGGSDCHGKLPYAFVPMKLCAAGVSEFTPEGLRDALVAGRVTFGTDGGTAAADLAATSDVEGERCGVGGALRAKSEVRLTWTGKAMLVEDGVRVGEFEGGAVRKVEPPGSFHVWRIEKPGDAYSNMVHANL
jgi:hypothetical protein